MTLPAQIYTSIYSFSNYYCGCPLAQLQTDGTALYGATSTAGGASSTYLFKVNPDGSGYEALPTQNHSPAPGVVVSGIAVYALGPSVGPWLYKVYVDGTGFSLLGGASGAAYPNGGLIMSGAVVYGTSSSAVFKINEDGTGAAVLHTFAGSPDGAQPKAGLALNGGTLYGTTYGGGSAGYGTVFAINTNGSNYSILYNFTNGVDGANPQAELLWTQGVLYGTARSGGSFGQGTVFKLNPDGSGYTVLRAFTNTPDGANPQAGLALVGTTFYGTTCFGGSAGQGTIFQLSVDGSGYQVIRSFQGWGTGDGLQPSGTLKVCCGAMYGVTICGGTNSGGTIYRLSLPPPPLQIASINNQPVVFWQDDGFTHSLEMTTNLASGVWTTLSSGAPIMGVQITNVMQPSNGFFRLQ